MSESIASGDVDDSRATMPLQISVVYALADRQHSVSLLLDDQATVQLALERSGLLRRFPEIQQRTLACAIFGLEVALSTPLRNGDRVEILRPLLIDPKESRRQAAARSRRKSS